MECQEEDMWDDVVSSTDELRAVKYSQADITAAVGEALADLRRDFEALKALHTVEVLAEREACANLLNLYRSDVSLMAGEMTAQEWRTIAAVLTALQSRMRSNAGIHHPRNG